MTEKPLEDVLRELSSFMGVIKDATYLSTEMLSELREAISEVEVSEALLILQRVEDKQSSIRDLLDLLISVLDDTLS